MVNCCDSVSSARTLLFSPFSGFELETMEHLLIFWNRNMAPFTRRHAQLISQAHGEETPITGIRRLESVRD